MLAAYQQSLYGWRNGRSWRWWRIGDRAPGERFAILTAWNPASRPLPRWRNRKRQRHLQRLLRGRWPTRPARGGLRGWWEESLAVKGIPLSSACRIARRFDQNAFLWADGRRVHLVLVSRES